MNLSELSTCLNLLKRVYNYEFELIKKYNPELNKIKHRKQNLNCKLTEKEYIKAFIPHNNGCKFSLVFKDNRGYILSGWM